MGLDNGFCVKHINVNDCPLKTIRARLTEMEQYPDYDPEIVYWRKHWGLRNDILKVLHASSEDYHIQVDREDLPAIIKTIIPYMSKEFWDENSESIWEFEDAINWLPWDVIALSWLYDYWKTHPEVEVYFYDSY